MRYVNVYEDAEPEKKSKPKAEAPSPEEKKAPSPKRRAAKKPVDSPDDAA